MTSTAINSDARVTEAMCLASNIFVVYLDLVNETASECDVDVVRTSDVWVEFGESDIRTFFEVNGRPHCVEQFRNLASERLETLRQEIIEEPLFDHCRINLSFGTEAKKLGA